MRQGWDGWRGLGVVDYGAWGAAGSWSLPPYEASEGLNGIGGGQSCLWESLAVQKEGTVLGSPARQLSLS